MKIGLYNLEMNINNTAMMQLSQYYKDKGHHVELYNHLTPNRYDLVWAFSLFNFTDKGMVTPRMITGGTGFNISKELPPWMQKSDLDYSIFPKCETSYIWFSRGCIRNCPFCVVRQKEGYIEPVKPKNINPNGKYVTVMDNNFFANPEWDKSIQQLKEWKQKVDLQGFDIRIFDKEQGKALQELKHYKQFKFAWDNPKQDITEKINELTQYIKKWKLMCYVLIGYDSTESEDIYRVEKLRNLGIDPFVMPYDKFDPYQMAYARYVNNKAVFYSTTWNKYCIQKKITV